MPFDDDCLPIPQRVRVKPRASDEEMRRGSEARPIVIPTGDRGYHAFFLQPVTQADTGVDSDFLQSTTLNGAVPRI